ncbi:NAD(P)-binding protein [Dothidotthia symphoricarpi CBS 119687]|uniref:NAD(P)-binding protein n=1 Tax=Dothidotthia symphoricarpi CBS 119687 TaxID=1392245 RepID=A0A6A6AFZ2_9PLEO|nr:NAD(P)-binding protein [Dothidotthia symphoricarpi CBS 119687]KAF2130892.1 NAD(P)-binding protein [Dothidotthia symphoricarpi CBS 119687]
MLALTSTTGKLGSAVLRAILDNQLIDPKELVICTSSSPKEGSTPSQTHSITTRHATFDQPSSLVQAYTGCTALFLVSTPHIAMDYNNAPLWQGREAHHRAAIDAAIQAGVEHIYYTSLAFANPSKAGVMRAHIRTERYLKDLEREGKVKFTILREGLYNESWPLYFGYYFGLKEDKRSEVAVAGDGSVAWTAIADMAFATAKILAAPSEEWAGKMVYLSQKKTCTLEDIAGIVSKVRGEDVKLKVVGKKEYEDFYVEEKGMERPSVEWWSSTYDALRDGECAIDDPTLETMLAQAGRSPKTIEDTIKEMLR